MGKQTSGGVVGQRVYRARHVLFPANDLQRGRAWAFFSLNESPFVLLLSSDRLKTRQKVITVRRTAARALVVDRFNRFARVYSFVVVEETRQPVCHCRTWKREPRRRLTVLRVNDWR